MATLEEIGLRVGTDKGTWHSYLPLYEKLFAPLRNDLISILELGVCNGASMRMWLEYFPRADVHGIDITRLVGLSDPRLTLHQFSAVDARRLELFRDRRFDIIIDDASHRPSDQVFSFVHLWRCLKPNGYYIVEDVLLPDALEGWRLSGLDLQVYEFNKMPGDTVIVIRKRRNEEWPARESGGNA